MSDGDREVPEAARAMDFPRVVRLVGGWLDERQVEWAVVGGLALAAHGAGRLTNDVDIVTERRAQEELIGFLEEVGYRTLHRSAGYSNHLHGEPALGRVDVVYVDGRTARELFAAAETVTVVAGLSARVPRVEHLVAMKVLAAKNDASRALQELADIAALLRASGTPADAVRVYFERHGLLAEWRRLRDAL